MLEIDESKTIMTEEHVRILYQTIADIIGEENNIKIIVSIEKK